MTRSLAARKQDDEEPGPDPSPTTRGASAPQNASLPRARRAGVVLIADDTHDIRELYGLHLTHDGFLVELASDGRAAVERAIALRPDVIVMDFAMPLLDGIAATQRLKSHSWTRKIPVILLTGYPYKAMKQGALEAGVDVFLTKPCLPEDLGNHVRRVLQTPPD